MRKLILTCLVSLSSASVNAAIFKCADIPTPTPTCQFGVHVCNGYGWCGPGCHTETCLPGPLPGATPFQKAAALSAGPNSAAPVTGPSGPDGKPCDFRHLWSCH